MKKPHYKKREPTITSAPIIYTRDADTDIWRDKNGKRFRLEDHGCHQCGDVMATNRLDLVPITN